MASLGAVAALWLVPVLLTLASAPAGAILVTTSAAAAICVGFNLSHPRAILTTLPFFALLSPMTGLLDLGGARLVYSDLLFLVLAVQATTSAITDPAPRHGRAPMLLPVLALFYLLATTVGLAAGYLASFKPLLYILQLTIVVYFTSRQVRDSTDWAGVRDAWIVATVFGALILLQAYGEGRNLDNLKEANETQVTASSDLLTLFRSSYYYSGFHYTLGICVVWLGTRLLFPASRGHKAIVLLALLAVVSALISTVNKTALAAVGAGLTMTAIALFLRFRREMASTMTWLIVLAVGALAAVAWQYGQLAEETQIGLVLERLSNAGSFSTRLEVFEQALTVWFSSPWTVLLGFGPDLLDNSGNPAIANLLKTSAATGFVEGTVDSAWLSYLIELGLPSGVLLAVLFARGIANALRGLKSLRRFDDRAYAEVSLFGGLVFLAMAMTTQMLGYTKICWLPLQLLVVAAIGLRHRRAG